MPDDGRPHSHARPRPALHLVTAADAPAPRTAPRRRAPATFHAEARAACAPLARALAQVGAPSDADEQATATAWLARRAGALGVQAGALPSRAAVRLLRLGVRHWGRLPETARAGLQAAVFWLDAEHRDVAALVTEVARAELAPLSDGLLMAREATRDDDRWAGSLVARLAPLLDDPSLGWTTRLIAADWIARAPTRRALPALLRAVREPHLGVRRRALDALACFDPLPLTAADLEAQLGDLAEYGLPDNHDLRDDVNDYLARLDEFVQALRPEGAADTLGEILAYGPRRQDGWGDDGLSTWCLAALAATWPEDALDAIDEWLEAPACRKRMEAVDAARLLPAALARPRLLAAAADGAPDVAARARATWQQAYGEPCVLDDLAGIPVGLLVNPPSEGFAGRVRALREESHIARVATAEALLAAAPDREALALLVFALDDEALRTSRARAGTETAAIAWGAVLVARFGAAGVDAVCELITRAPRCGSRSGFDSWLHAAGVLVERGAIPPEHQGSLRAMATAVVACGDAPMASDACEVLRRVGAGADALDALWALAVEGGADAAAHYRASQALAAHPPEAALDGRLAAAVAADLAAGNWERFARAAALGITRRVPAVLELAAGALDATDDAAGPAAWDALQTVSSYLWDAGRLPEEWVAAALARHEAPQFVVAARRVVQIFHRDKAAPGLPALRAGLERALLSGARGGETAAEAASSLLDLGVLKWNGRVLARIFRAAPPARRLRLLQLASCFNPPLEPLWPGVLELFATTDAALAAEIEAWIWEEHMMGPRAWMPPPRLRALRDAAKVESLRDTLADVLDLTEAEPFWQDG